MYTSLLISLLAAFVAMLGKQWLNRYLRNSGGSMIERCGDRQRKCDGLEKWPLHLFVESLPVMLQIALLLLACGLCKHMWTINISIAYILIGLTGVGVLFYLAIVIAGMSSYACPFQTPASSTLCSLWKNIRRGVVSCILHYRRILSWTHQMWNQRARLLHRRSLSTTIPLESLQVQPSELWLTPKDLTIIRQTNTSDVLCVSWILRNITDPEALDAAIRLAGVIRWFDDGVNIDPPYDLIVSMFETCFDSTRKLHPRLRDRAYYSGRAMVWIRTLAMRKSEEFANTFTFPVVEYTDPALDADLGHLLRINVAWLLNSPLIHLLSIHAGHTPSHSQWISNVLLHLAWADQTPLDFGLIADNIFGAHKTYIPLSATLNRLLAWCIFLGSPVKEEALKVEDKSYDISCFFPSSCSLFLTSDRLERILHQLSTAVISTISGTHTQRKLIPYVLRDLIEMENRPQCLTEMAYEWCSVIYENRRSLWDWENLLLVSLKIGFRHLDVRSPYIRAWLTHTDHHRELADVVFKSRKSEVIADLLYAWTTRDYSLQPAHTSLGICTGHLVSLHDLAPFSSRLRQLVIRSVELIGYKGFEGVGVERFIELLNRLRVTVVDMEQKDKWAKLLLDILQFSDEAQSLSHWFWELLVEVAPSWSEWLRCRLPVPYNPRITKFLVQAQEWSKLECWMGTVWMVWPPGVDGITGEDIDHLMLLLFRQRPGAAHKLERWMERWSQECGKDIPKSFRRICKRAHRATQLDAPYVPFHAHRVCSKSYTGLLLILGQFHPLMKDLRNLPTCHHHYPEATNSGSRYRITSSSVWNGTTICTDSFCTFNSIVLRTLDVSRRRFFVAHYREKTLHEQTLQHQAAESHPWKSILEIHNKLGPRWVCCEMPA